MTNEADYHKPLTDAELDEMTTTPSAYWTTDQKFRLLHQFRKARAELVGEKQ